MFKYIYAMLNMGSYGWYVWPCYFLLVLVFGAHVYFALRTQRNLQAKFRVSNE